jgi:hypothetical protein
VPVYDEVCEVGDDALDAGDVVVLDKLCGENRWAVRIKSWSFM